MKDCGSCEHFIKFKNDRHSGGICQRFDQRTNTDHGRGCDQWKGIKYRRRA